MPRPPQLRSDLPSDADFVSHAVALKRNLALNRASAKTALLALLLIQADMEGTTMSGVLEKLMRSAPSRHDQYALLRRYRAAMEES